MILPGRTLTHREICDVVADVAPRHDIAKVSYFGSYANGRATTSSDLDLLIVFNKKEQKSLLNLLAFQKEMEDTLGVAVDVLHSPLPKNTFLNVVKEVLVYEQP